MSEFVSSFPPPPSYFRQFSQEGFSLAPPAVVPLKNREIYGGSMLLPESGEDGFDPTKDYRRELTRCLREYVAEGLNFFSDENSKQPFDKGAIAVEMKSNALYTLLNEYRSHEARERLCCAMREQAKELTDLRESLRSTLDEAEALHESSGKCDQQLLE